MKRPTTKPSPSPPPTTERFHTVAAVAERRNVCERTVRRHIKVGLLKAHRFGRAVRISDSELQNYGSKRK